MNFIVIVSRARDHPDNLFISEEGIQINLGKKYYSKRIEISLDNNDNYQIIYLSGEAEIEK